MPLNAGLAPLGFGAAYRTRERVERLINRLKQLRRVTTRYEKRGHHYLAFVTLAAIILWLPV